MTDNFPAFAKLAAASLQAIFKTGKVFVVGIEPDALYRAYLAAFPEGTNPIFKERTEHDCSCCKHFIRRVGAVVSITDDGKICTLWDEAAEKAATPYDKVAAAMRDAVRAAPIVDLFRVLDKEASFGSAQTRSQDKVSQRILTWNHFYTGEIPKNLRSSAPDKVCGEYRTNVQVFERGLTELKPEAIETTLGLIDAPGEARLYRGAEFRDRVLKFQKAQAAYAQKNAAEKSTFIWSNVEGDIAKFRNIVIGQLVQDLSAGVEVEKAVASFEKMVAPGSYRRTTAPISPAMVKRAMEDLEKLGLLPALERRFARIEDISVNDVKWVDTSVQSLMKGGIADILMKVAESNKDTKAEEERAEDIDIDSFMKRVLPETTGMEILFKNQHLNNLMSLTAPVHQDTKQLFIWQNDFAFSYIGNVADSIKERVKKAGGNIVAPLRISLGWSNGDDEDLHVWEPVSSKVPKSNHIGYDTRYRKDRDNGFSPLGGQLDLDMNAGVAKNSVDPVENIYWKKINPGTYLVQVMNFAKRSDENTGFTIEIECNGKIYNFFRKTSPKHQEIVSVLEMTIENNVPTFKVLDPNITTTAISQDKWGLRTETFVKVNVVTLSPNYWGDNAVGNKHTFFILDGCKNDEPTRGIYNEFLHPRLQEHRKVFEVIGEKTKCKPTEGQLSGLGFSSTKPDNFIVRVKQGKKSRLFNVKVGA